MSPNRAGHLTLLPTTADFAEKRDIANDLNYLAAHQKHSILTLFGRCETFQQSNPCQAYFDFVSENQTVFELYFRAAETNHQSARLREAVNYLQMITYLTVMTSNLGSIRRRNYGYLFCGFEPIVDEVISRIKAQRTKKDSDLTLELVVAFRNSALAAGE